MPLRKNRTPDLTGTWMTQSESAIYRNLPKCGCTTIGQILYYTDHGHFYNGNVHRTSTGIHRWSTADRRTRAQIQRKVKEQNIFTFSCVRNPYTRVLSCFFDKICNVQNNGEYHLNHLLQLPMQKYGIDLQAAEDASELDQIKLFHRFLLFARDTVHWQKPMSADPHWQPMYRLLASIIVNGGRYNSVSHIETFHADMPLILDSISPSNPIQLNKIPQFNSASDKKIMQKYPVADYFDDLSMHLMHEMYHQDFDLFKYDFDTPGNSQPTGPIDLDEIQSRLNRDEYRT